MMIDPAMAATVVETAEQALQTQDGESIRAGVWATAGVVATGLVTALGIWLNNRRSMADAAQIARNEDFKRLREEIERRDADMDEMRAELKAMQERMEAAERRAGGTELKMVKLQTGFELVSGELARHDPENKILKQARDLIAQAAMSDEDVFTAALTSLSRRHA